MTSEFQIEWRPIDNVRPYEHNPRKMPAGRIAIVRRWQQLTGRPATLDGDGRSFDEIKAERLG
jgi:hypothetical protein